MPSIAASFAQSSTEHFGEVVRELKQRCNLK